MKSSKQFFKSGDVFIWFTGFGLAITLAMISGLMLLILIHGTEYLYPSDIAKIEMHNGEIFLGEIEVIEDIPKLNLPDSLKEKGLIRYKVKIGNRDIYGLDFRWFDERDVKNISYPTDATIVERIEHGDLHGFISGIENDKKIIRDSSKIEELYSNLYSYVSELRSKINNLNIDEVSRITYEINELKQKQEEIRFSKNDENYTNSDIKEYENKIVKYNSEYKNVVRVIDSLRLEASKVNLIIATPDGNEKYIPFLQIVQVYNPNNMNLFSKAISFIEKFIEFIVEEPRESNTEGGVFPAIFGTVLMVILMSLAAVPFGIITALYLREYAKQGVVVRAVRIAVNNLAGVPSIVFGIFGLGFFIYTVGGTIDQLFYPEQLPTPTWGTGGILWASLTLALLTVPVVIVSTEEALTSIPRSIREAALALGSTKWQTIKNIILPAATPGILTGVILAMARGAGEVAPLMITGVVKLAPSLPIDSYFPFFHLDRKFMHLGFNIYDVGFQSPNVEAALPMVYMTTLLLVAIVVLLNVTAMVIRTRLKKKYKAASF